MIMKSENYKDLKRRMNPPNPFWNPQSRTPQRMKKRWNFMNGKDSLTPKAVVRGGWLDFYFETEGNEDITPEEGGQWFDSLIQKYGWDQMIASFKREWPDLELDDEPMDSISEEEETPDSMQEFYEQLKEAWFPEANILFNYTREAFDKRYTNKVIRESFEYLLECVNKPGRIKLVPPERCESDGGTSKEFHRRIREAAWQAHRKIGWKVWDFGLKWLELVDAHGWEELANTYGVRKILSLKQKEELTKNLKERFVRWMREQVPEATRIQIEGCWPEFTKLHS
jgi:hypothetical protein